MEMVRISARIPASGRDAFRRLAAAHGLSVALLIEVLATAADEADAGPPGRMSMPTRFLNEHPSLTVGTSPLRHCSIARLPPLPGPPNRRRLGPRSLALLARPHQLTPPADRP